MLEPHVRGSQQLTLRRDLGAILDRNRHQFSRRLIGRQERDLNERWFERFKKRFRIKKQDLCKPALVTRQSRTAISRVCLRL